MLFALSADDAERCRAVDELAKEIRSFRLTEIMERVDLEDSFERMKRDQYAKDRSNRYTMYYIVR